MKLEKFDKSHDGKDKIRFNFIINREELNLIQDLLSNFDKILPKMEITSQVRDKIDSMQDTLRFGLYAEKRFGENFKAKE